MRNLSDLEVEILGKDTVIFYLNGVKFSFFKYPYKLIKPPETIKDLYGIKLASDEDIVSMKAVAILQRGTKKDFYDLWFLMKRNQWKLENIIQFCKEKYGNVFPESQFLKAVNYFEDAEEVSSYSEIEADWEKVKKFFIKETERYLREFP